MKSRRVSQCEVARGAAKPASGSAGLQGARSVEEECAEQRRGNSHAHLSVGLLFRLKFVERSLVLVKTACLHSFRTFYLLFSDLLRSCCAFGICHRRLCGGFSGILVRFGFVHRSIGFVHRSSGIICRR